MEKILRTIDETILPNGVCIRVVESSGEFGSHYVLVTGNEFGFHSVDLDRVMKYYHDIVKYF